MNVEANFVVLIENHIKMTQVLYFVYISGNQDFLPINELLLYWQGKAPSGLKNVEYDYYLVNKNLMQ